LIRVGHYEGFTSQFLLFRCPDVSQHVLDVALHSLGLVNVLLFLKQIYGHSRLVTIEMENVLSVFGEIRNQIFAAFLVLHVYFSRPKIVVDGFD
jgi:hypothetical protein